MCSESDAKFNIALAEVLAERKALETAAAYINKKINATRKRETEIREGRQKEVEKLKRMRIVDEAASKKSNLTESEIIERLS